MSNGINSAFAQNSFFTAETQQLQVLGFSGVGNSYPVLKPKPPGIVDVVNKMRWKNGGSTDEVPVVWVTERVLRYGVWTANLLQFLTQFQNLVNNKDIDSYLNLYAAEKTGFQYNFPLLLSNGDNIRTVRNQWVTANGVAKYLEDKAGTAGGFGDIVGAGLGFITGAITPGFGYEETYQYGKTDTASLKVTFPLYNTFDLKSAFDHYSFVQLITFQNLKTRTSMLTYIPPKIYTVDTLALGGVYMAAAYISELKIDSIGTTRRMSDFFGYGSKEILIPEAYKVSITFTDLVSQSSNIFAGTMGGTKIEVTGIPEEIIRQGEQIVQAGVNQINSIYNATTTTDTPQNQQQGQTE
jgi:hypothetical protein